VKRCLGAVFIVSVAFAGFASGAQQPTEPSRQPQQAEPSVSGTVISTGSISFAIRADDGDAKSFLILTSTSLPSGGFRLGDRVNVAFQPIDGEHAAATTVELSAAADTATSSLARAPGSVSVATATETNDHSDVWRGLLVVGLLSVALALAVATLVNLLHAPREGRHTNA
jgi:hypothetical protein